MLFQCRVETFEKRSKDDEAHMHQFQTQLSSLEQHLMTTQQIVTVRGKHGRPVPILIPADILPAMELLTLDLVRKSVGIRSDNPYVFANFGKHHLK